MVAVLATSAWAQDVVEDFDADPPGVAVNLGSAGIGAPPVTLAGDALEILPQLGPAYGYGDVSMPGPYLATRTRGRFDQLADDRFPNGIQVVLYGDAGGVAFLDGNVLTTRRVWSSYDEDASDVCGDRVSVEVLAWSGNPYQTGTSTVAYWMDNLGFTGDPCPVFVDGDGDGACAQGVDLDHDGACVGPGEPLDPGTVVDCDDAVDGGCLVLDPPTVVPGAPVSFRVSGAAAGERVGVLASTGTRHWCPVDLGGPCLALRRPLAVGSALADGSGVATVVAKAPSGLGSGDQGWFQAVVWRPGAVGDTSPPVQVTIP